jgi:hypothetical protein
MLYVFKSKAAGDLIMLGPNGDHVLRILGKEPAEKGIIEPAAMPGAIRALEEALAAEPSKPRPAGGHARVDGSAEAEPDVVTLRQRSSPLLQMMKRALAEDEPIVWGV